MFVVTSLAVNAIAPGVEIGMGSPNQDQRTKSPTSAPHASHVLMYDEVMP